MPNIRRTNELFSFRGGFRTCLLAEVCRKTKRLTLVFTSFVFCTFSLNNCTLAICIRVKLERQNLAFSSCSTTSKKQTKKTKSWQSRSFLTLGALAAGHVERLDGVKCAIKERLGLWCRATATGRQYFQFEMKSRLNITNYQEEHQLWWTASHMSPSVALPFCK